MPIYTFSCGKCGEFEVYHNMNEAHPNKCPTCAGEIERVFNQRFIPPADSGWESENNGAGRYIGSLGDHNDKESYCRSRTEAKDKLIRKGFQPSQIEFA